MTGDQSSKKHHINEPEVTLSGSWHMTLKGDDPSRSKGDDGHDVGDEGSLNETPSSFPLQINLPFPCAGSKN